MLSLLIFIITVCFRCCYWYLQWLDTVYTNTLHVILNCVNNTLNVFTHYINIENFLWWHGTFWNVVSTCATASWMKKYGRERVSEYMHCSFPTSVWTIKFVFVLSSETWPYMSTVSSPLYILCKLLSTFLFYQHLYTTHRKRTESNTLNKQGIHKQWG